MYWKYGTVSPWKTPTPTGIRDRHRARDPPDANGPDEKKARTAVESVVEPSVVPIGCASRLVMLTFSEKIRVVLSNTGLVGIELNIDGLLPEDNIGGLGAPAPPAVPVLRVHHGRRRRVRSRRARCAVQKNDAADGARGRATDTLPRGRAHIGG